MRERRIKGFALVVLMIGSTVLAQQGAADDPRLTGNLFVNVAREVSPAVVSVRTEQVRGAVGQVESPPGDAWPIGDDLFERFFGESMLGTRTQGERRQQRARVGQGRASCSRSRATRRSGWLRG